MSGNCNHRIFPFTIFTSSNLCNSTAARFITPFDSFAFGTKGSLLITAQVEVDDLEDAQKVIADTDKLAIFICPSKHYSVLVTDASSILKICGDGANPTSPTSSDCKVAPVNGTTTYITFDSQAIYRFCAVNCMKLTSQYQYTWINMSYTGMRVVYFYFILILISLASHERNESVTHWSRALSGSVPCGYFRLDCCCCVLGISDRQNAKYSKYFTQLFDSWYNSVFLLPFQTFVNIFF